jgi:hypothetical protein
MRARPDPAPRARRPARHSPSAGAIAHCHAAPGDPGTRCRLAFRAPEGWNAACRSNVVHHRLIPLNEAEQGGDDPAIRPDAGGGTRRSRGHWGTLDNVIGGPARVPVMRLVISVPRAKPAPRRKSVLRYPTLEYQHEQPSPHPSRVATIGSVAFRVRQRVFITSVFAEGSMSPLDKEKPYQRLT